MRCRRGREGQGGNFLQWTLIFIIIMVGTLPVIKSICPYEISPKSFQISCPLLINRIPKNNCSVNITVYSVTAENLADTEVSSSVAESVKRDLAAPLYADRSRCLDWISGKEKRPVRRLPVSVGLR